MHGRFRTPGSGGAFARSGGPSKNDQALHGNIRHEPTTHTPGKLRWPKHVDAIIRLARRRPAARPATNHPGLLDRKPEGRNRPQRHESRRPQRITIRIHLSITAPEPAATSIWNAKGGRQAPQQATAGGASSKLDAGPRRPGDPARTGRRCPRLRGQRGITVRRRDAALSIHRTDAEADPANTPSSSAARLSPPRASWAHT